MAEGSVVTEHPQTEHSSPVISPEAKKTLSKREWFIKKLKKASQIVGLAAFTMAHMYQPGAYDAHLKDVGKAMQMNQRRKEDDTSRLAIEMKSEAPVDKKPPVEQQDHRKEQKDRQRMQTMVEDARLKLVRDELKEAA